MKAKSAIEWIKDNTQLVCVMFLSFILRFVNLGYSDYQGDEIKAFYLPTLGQSFFQYIMDQRKGPVQFVVTLLVKIFNPTYSNQFVARFPFAIAGLLAVLFFYKFVEIHFGKKIAFYSALFFSFNGFFIAFSRIVQYQSFILVFMLASLYYLSLAVKNRKYWIKGLYIGLICWTLALLTHYDAIFIVPFVTYLLILWFKNKDLAKSVKIKHFLISGTISAILVLSFYIPFVLDISSDTQKYWSIRISGDDGSGRISSSKYLFTVYHPIYVVHIYVALLALGIFFIGLGLVSGLFLRLKGLPRFAKSFFTHSTQLMEGIQKESGRIVALFAWILIAVLFFEVFVKIPGTHIYSYIIPSFVVLAYGLVTLESLTFRVFEYGMTRILNALGITLLFAFLFAQSYFVFVDNSVEYPWEEERFLIWTFPKPSPGYQLSMFGFPYFRDWEGISTFTKAFPQVEAYSTNEKKSIARFYTPLQKSTDKAGFFIYIRNPQSFENSIVYDKAAYWASKYEPVHTLTRNGKDLVRIYMMEPGTLEDIKSWGF